MRRPASTPSAERVLRVERIGAGGDGVVRGDADHTPCYLPLTLPGETVRARVVGQRGAVHEILAASPERVAPPCPHFGACGGCALQHWREDAYLRWKVAQVEAALRRAGFDGVPMGAPVRTPPGARRRLDLALRRSHTGLQVGLHRSRGAAVVDLDVCLVARPELVRLIAPLRALLNGSRLVRKSGAAIINLLDSGPDLLLRTDGTADSAARAALAQFARTHGIPRISWAAGDGAPEPVVVLKPTTVTFSNIPVAPPAGAFLQASADGERAIVDVVLAGLPAPLPARGRIVELFAGCGTLTFPLAAAARVAAYEGNADAVAALQRAARANRLEGRIIAAQRDLARRPLTGADLSGAFAVILDPPHAGALAQMPGIAAARPERIIYVSCNAAALANDARMLCGAGYGLLQVRVIDQFLWSAQIECVCVFAPFPAINRS